MAAQIGVQIGHRPSSFTPENQEKIIQYISEGNYVTTACQIAGIPRSTYYYWKEKADAGMEEYVAFFERIEQSEALAEAERVKTIKEASKNGQWQASAWYLERKHSDRWGRKDKVENRIEVSGEVIHRNEIALESKLQLDAEGAQLLKQLYARRNVIDIGGNND